MRYIVTWPAVSVQVRKSNGDLEEQIVHNGSPVPEGVDGEVLENLAAVGALLRTADEPVLEQAEVVTPPEAVAPAKTAQKADWVAWAVLCGAVEADAEALNKDQLVEQYADAKPAK